MPVFKFNTKWIFEAPVKKVWHEINNPPTWPKWWRGLYKVTVLKPGDTTGLGAIYSYSWGNPWLYTLKFDLEITDIQYNKYIRGKARGDVEGIGTWYFTQENELAHIEYNWHIRTVNTSFSLLAIFFRPVLIFNHKLIMIAGAKGLANKLNIKQRNIKRPVRPILK